MLWQFGNSVAIWYIFPRFWYFVSKTIWQPCSGAFSDEQGDMELKNVTAFFRRKL
jgi:hypothetical protein